MTISKNNYRTLQPFRTLTRYYSQNNTKEKKMKEFIMKKVLGRDAILGYIIAACDLTIILIFS